MDYTIASIDENHYNRVRVNLPQPSWKYSNVMITSCVMNCNIRVLKVGDYVDFTIGGTPYRLQITSNITELQSAKAFIASLPSFSNVNEIPIMFYVNTDNTISINAESEFSINDLSYNMKLVLGLYTKLELPLNASQISTSYVIDIKSIGYFLSTPVLYLLSNVGGVNFFNQSDKTKIDSSSISMRLLNSFTPSMPIIGSNSEFSKIVFSTDLTDFELILVDANLHEVELLNPMYLTINVSNASDQMTLEDADKYEYTRKANKEQELVRLQMMKVKFDRINKEMNDEFSLKFET